MTDELLKATEKSKGEAGIRRQAHAYTTLYLTKAETVCLLSHLTYHLLACWFREDTETGPTVRRRLYDIVKVLEVFGILRKKTGGDEVSNTLIVHGKANGGGGGGNACRGCGLWPDRRSVKSDHRDEKKNAKRRWLG